MSELNPLNDLSRVYLDHVANANQQNDDKDIKRWEEGNDALDKQMETSSKQLATLGAPQMEEEVSYVESYLSELNKTLVGSPVKEDAQSDAVAQMSGAGGDPQDDAMKQLVDAEKKRSKKKVKKEEVELDEAERALGDRLHRKRKLYDKTTRKAMDDAWRTGEASGHNRFNMGRLDREMDKVKDKMKKEK